MYNILVLNITIRFFFKCQYTRVTVLQTLDCSSLKRQYFRQTVVHATKCNDVIGHLFTFAHANGIQQTVS